MHSFDASRSAESLTIAVSSTLLLLRSGSITTELPTLALLVILVGPPAEATVLGSTKVTISNVTDFPLSMSPSVHVTTWPTAVHPAGGLRLFVRYWACGGSVSVTVTLVAGSGPLFVTVRVQVSCVPAITGSGEWLFVTARSAWGRSISHSARPAAAV